MYAKLFQLFRNYYHQIRSSIAFVPAILALTFLIGAILIIRLDFSKPGEWVLERLPIIQLNDPTTARSILSTIIGGIISLTVFSFSLVMIMLNQAASSLTNRLLQGLVREKFHQVVMGIYIGTIVYTLVLLFQIREPTSDTIKIPSIAIFIAIILSVTDVFLFIYFLHYVTQSVKYSNIIQKIYNQTQKALNHKRQAWIYNATFRQQTEEMEQGNWKVYHSIQSGYLQDVQEEPIIALAHKHNIQVRMEQAYGAFIIKDTPLYAIRGTDRLEEDIQKQINYAMDFYWGENIDENTLYGYRQLSEIAMKALSPGINDPRTAILCMHALGDLLEKKIHHTEQFVFKDEDGTPRLYLKPHTFQDIFSTVFHPILNYGKGDSQVLATFLDILAQLRILDGQRNEHREFFMQHLVLLEELINQHIENQITRTILLAKIEQVQNDL